MSREEAEQVWDALWETYQNTIDSNDKWYVGGYCSYISRPGNGMGEFFNTDYGKQFKDAWLMGNADARGDWP